MIKRLRIFGDLHAHPFAYGAKVLEGGVNSRLNDAIEVLEEVLCHGTEGYTDFKNAPEIVLFLGDLFHQRGTLPTGAVTRVLEAFTEWRAHNPDAVLVALAGNHDLVGREGESALRMLNALADVHKTTYVVEEPEVIVLGDVEIIAYPYQDQINDTDYELLRGMARRTLSAKYDDEKLLSARPRLIFACHNGITANGKCDYPGEPSWRAEDLALILPAGTHCVSGHWHEPMAPLTVRAHTGGDLVVFRPGATHQHNWGDLGGTRGFIDLVTPENYDQHKAMISLPDECIPWDIRPYETESAPRFYESGPGGLDLTNVRAGIDFVRLTGTPEVAQRLREDGNYNVVEVVPPPVTERKVRVDLSEATGESAVFEAYMRGTEPAGVQTDLLVKLGQEVLKEVAR